MAALHPHRYGTKWWGWLCFLARPLPERTCGQSATQPGTTGGSWKPVGVWKALQPWATETTRAWERTAGHGTEGASMLRRARRGGGGGESGRRKAPPPLAEGWTGLGRQRKSQGEGCGSQTFSCHLGHQVKSRSRVSAGWCVGGCGGGSSSLAGLQTLSPAPAQPALHRPLRVVLAILQL